MDAAHQEHLNRILRNRRERGATLPPRANLTQSLSRASESTTTDSLMYNRAPPPEGPPPSVPATTAQSSYPKQPNRSVSSQGSYQPPPHENPQNDTYRSNSYSNNTGGYNNNVVYRDDVNRRDNQFLNNVGSFIREGSVSGTGGPPPPPPHTGAGPLPSRDSSSIPRGTAAAAGQPPYGRPPPAPSATAYPQQSQSQQRPPSISSSDSRGGGGLFTRGTFDNFRHNPVLVSPNISRSYRRDPNDSSMAQQYSPQQIRQRQVTATVAQNAEHKNVTSANPFRTQRFDDFVEAPNYDAPMDPEERRQIARAQMTTVPGMNRSPMQDEGGRPVQQPQAAPVFDLQQSIDILCHGDWFLKWTMKKDKVHRRYFWLDRKRSMIYWGKTPETYIYFMTSSIKLEEITGVQSQCVVDDFTGKVLYLLIIATQTRLTQMGTEKREKFDLWFDCLQRLTDSVREYNAKFFSRYTTKPIEARRNTKRAQASD